MMIYSLPDDNVLPPLSEGEVVELLKELHDNSTLKSLGLSSPPPFLPHIHMFHDMIFLR